MLPPSWGERSLQVRWRRGWGRVEGRLKPRAQSIEKLSDRRPSEAAEADKAGEARVCQPGAELGRGQGKCASNLVNFRPSVSGNLSSELVELIKPHGLHYTSEFFFPLSVSLSLIIYLFPLCSLLRQGFQQILIGLHLSEICGRSGCTTRPRANRSIALSYKQLHRLSRSKRSLFHRVALPFCVITIAFPLVKFQESQAMWLWCFVVFHSISFIFYISYFSLLRFLKWSFVQLCSVQLQGLGVMRELW